MEEKQALLNQVSFVNIEGWGNEKIRAWINLIICLFFCLFSFFKFIYFMGCRVHIYSLRNGRTAERVCRSRMWLIVVTTLKIIILLL